MVAKGASSAVIDQNNNITTNNGTSFSSPIMAGAITSFWQANPQRTNADVMQIVRESASLYTNPTSQLGYGIPDFGAALDDLLTLEDYNNKSTYQIVPNPASEIAMIVFPEDVSKVDVHIYDILGKLVATKTVESQASYLPVSNLKKGVYLIQINDGSTLITQKFIKS